MCILKELYNVNIEPAQKFIKSGSEQERYIDGFCTGAKMLLQILNYKSENLYKESYIYNLRRSRTLILHLAF